MEKSLLNKIQNYSLYCSQEREYAEAIEERRHGSGRKREVPKSLNGPCSYVENRGIGIYTLQQKKAVAALEIARITRFIEESELTDQEKAVLWCAAENKALSKYARENNIKSSKVYKIRDRALRKIIKKQKKQCFSSKTG